MVKANVLKPLQKITHARQYLKAQRTAASFDPTMVQQVFRKWYRCNDDKLAVILRDSPEIRIGDSGHYGTPCFQFDGINVSSKLSPPTPEANVTTVLREIEYRTRPLESVLAGWADRWQRRQIILVCSSAASSHDCVWCTILQTTSVRQRKQ